MSARERFKSAFCQRCQQMGYSIDEALHLVKQASVRLDFIKQAASPLADWATRLTGAGLTAAIVAPPVLGALIGGGLRRAIQVHDQTPEDVAAQELLDEYEGLTDEMRRKRKMREYYQAKPQPRSYYY